MTCQQLPDFIDMNKLLFSFSRAQAFLTLLQGQIIERARLGAGPAPTSEEIERHIDTCVTFFLAAHHINRPD